MLGFPASVRYIDRKERPKRVFIKRSDGILEEVFQIHTFDPRQGRSLAEANALRWNQDQRSNPDSS